MMTQKHWDLMIRFVVNEASPAECNELEELFVAYPAYRQVVQELQVIWNARISSTPKFESLSAFANLRTKLHKGGCSA